MPTVTLLKCSKCRLRWVEEPNIKECPRCSKRFTLPLGVVVAGVQVEVKRMEWWGGTDGLLDPDVRSGLDTVYLHDRCPHRMISSHICKRCSQP